MVQLLLIGILFALAVWYLGRMVFKQFSVKDEGCSKGCGCAEVKSKKTESTIN